MGLVHVAEPLDCVALTRNDDDVAAVDDGVRCRVDEALIRRLRHWEEVGLLRPSGRTEGGFRLYTEADVAKILVIRRMKPLGFTLDR